MRLGTGNSEQQQQQPAFNDIRIDLRGARLASSDPSNNQNYYANQYPTENDQRSQGSVPSRISRYSGKTFAVRARRRQRRPSRSRIPSGPTDQSTLFQSVDIENARFEPGSRRRAQLEKLGHARQPPSEIRSTGTASAVRLALVGHSVHHSLLSTR